MTARLEFSTLNSVPERIARPQYDAGALGIGIVHLGLGAFHRAHQAVYTDDAVALSGGDWGIAGVSLHHPETPDALLAQDCLYTVEMLAREPSYRIIGALRRALFAPRDRDAVLGLLAAEATRIVTLTITEKGYCLDPQGNLDSAHPDIVRDLALPDDPRSALGWLAFGLESRAETSPITIISCDNVSDNGAKLARALRQFAERAGRISLKAAIDRASFPRTMVDCIVPAANEASRARVREALGLADAASVQREPFAQWVMENKFAGPRPDWAGVEIVEDVSAHERLKLHVLNACHSALAYLGLPRGFRFVREAIADPELSRFVDEMVATEIAPALAPLPVGDYWRRVRKRFANPMLDHSLAQIAEDGSVKLNARIFPILIENARAHRPFAYLAAIVRAWMDFVRAPGIKDPLASRFATWAKTGAHSEALLDDAAVFPDPFRNDPALRGALLAGER